jgi:hypothetical protein
VVFLIVKFVLFCVQWSIHPLVLQPVVKSVVCGQLPVETLGKAGSIF